MAICTFFGHKDCWELEEAVLRRAIEDLIVQGVTEFTVGHQGRFDGLVRDCLKSLQARHPHIRYRVVLAYLPEKNREYEDFSDTVFPEGIENVPRKFAVDWRNRYLVAHADHCICYVNHPWGGAYKFARMASNRGLRIINLGTAAIERDENRRNSK